jgi:DNA-binding Lrp family transcriptional regulator
METIDLKDKKILYHLFLHGRQSLRSIGRKVGLSKSVVTERVKKLQENEILLGYSTVFDYFKLGFTPLRFYFKYQYITQAIKKEIIDNFVKCKHTTSVFSTKGTYDLAVVMLVKNNTDIYPFWQKTLDNFGDYFANRVFSVYMGETIYRPSFLFDEKDDSIKPMLKRSWEQVEHDELDLRILKVLSLNARIPTIEIADKLNTTALTINNRIKKLIEKKVILGFMATPNIGKLGYQFMKVDIFLKEHNKIHQIIKYVEKNPYLIALDSTLGYADLEFEFILKNINQMHQIIEDISSRFPKIIRDYAITIVEKNHKFLVLPEEDKK